MREISGLILRRDMMTARIEVNSHNPPRIGGGWPISQIYVLIVAKDECAYILLLLLVVGVDELSLVDLE